MKKRKGLIGIGIALIILTFAIFVTFMFTNVSSDLYRSVQLIKDSKRKDNVELSIKSTTNLIKSFFLTKKFWADFEEVEKTSGTTDDSTILYTSVELNDFYKYQFQNNIKGSSDEQAVDIVSNTLSLIDDIDHLILNNEIYHVEGEKEMLIFSIVQFKDDED